MSAHHLLFLKHGDADHDRVAARSLGARLMNQGHTVFLTDSDDDLESFGDIVDGLVEISPADESPRAILYSVPHDAAGPRREGLEARAILSLPANDAELCEFTNQLASGSAS